MSCFVLLLSFCRFVVLSVCSSDGEGCTVARQVHANPNTATGYHGAAGTMTPVRVCMQHKPTLLCWKVLDLASSIILSFSFLTTFYFELDHLSYAE